MFRQSLHKIFIIVVLFSANLIAQNTAPKTIDTLQFPQGYPSPKYSALEQLKRYPSPRYFPEHKLLHLFNWMDPAYMGGLGQPNISRKDINIASNEIQKELGLNWHYGFVIANCRGAFNVAGYIRPCAKSDTCHPDVIDLANRYPQVPLHVITFCSAVTPKDIGRSPAFASTGKAVLDSIYYLDFDFYGKTKREVTFNLPDSFLRIDGLTQKFYLEKILKFLKRPIDFINENGEEPPGPYQFEAIQNDARLQKLKKSMKIDSWEDFMATRKLQMRNAYSEAFMKGVPALKNTHFSFYTIEAGPVDRFKWSIMKKCLSPINGMYYSTPDFYPRWPKNWKFWSGPWHGWQWIEFGRKIEIKGGDKLFSPFVAAGWSNNPEEDVRPAQWLGLLKCLGVIGAEFYYTGYFTLGKPFPSSKQWVWQAAMPSYAQAITSRYEDVLRNGNVLFDESGTPVITYHTDDPSVLITVRKHDAKEKYIIAATYQPFSNEKDALQSNKTVHCKIGDKQLKFEARRQGSVYVYEKLSDGREVFYQLDSWHENAHPDRWSRNFAFEAEVADNIIDSREIYSIGKGPEDFSEFTSYVKMNPHKEYQYAFNEKDSLTANLKMWVYYKGKGEINASILRDKKSTVKINVVLPQKANWAWYKVDLKESATGSYNITLKLLSGDVELDKVYFTSKETAPGLQ